MWRTLCLATVLVGCGANAPAATETREPAAADRAASASAVGDVPAPAPASEPEPAASVPPRSSEPSAPAEVRELGPEASEGEEIAAWIAARVREARAGSRQYVRVPLVFASDGWGCSCPPNFIGVSPDSHDGGETWVRVENASGQEFPSPPVQRGEGYELSRGQVVRVDGYFTGDVDQLDLREGGEPPEWLYRVSVFRVTHIDRAMHPERAPGARVGLLGEPQPVAPCARVVADPAPPLRVHARPSLRGASTGGLDNGTRVAPLEWQGNDWIRIDQPVSGWIWVHNTRPACEASR